MQAKSNTDFFKNNVLLEIQKLQKFIEESIDLQKDIESSIKIYSIKKLAKTDAISLRVSTENEQVSNLTTPLKLDNANANKQSFSSDKRNQPDTAVQPLATQKQSLVTPNQDNANR